MNKLLIDAQELSYLLREHKKDIGRDTSAIRGNIFAGVTFGFSSLFASYATVIFIPGFLWKTGALIGSLIYTMVWLIELGKVKMSGYNSESLYKDIEDINQIEHEFSIVAVRDSFSAYPNRFLLHYDPDWDCRFFFSFRTQETEEKNLAFIRDRLSGLLGIDPAEIHVSYVTESVYPKFSEKDKVRKMYHHRLYTVVADHFPEEEQKNFFTRDGVSYTWMSLSQMEQDPRIEKVNMDVVNLVKDNVA